MRHKWMAALVVTITTLTTAQEAFKQYDGLKTEAAAWATMRLWTGFLGSYTPPDEPYRAQLTTCHVGPTSEEPQQSAAPSLAQTVRSESAGARRQQAANEAPRVELFSLDDDHRSASVEAVREALASVREVELLNAHEDREAEGPGEQSDETDVEQASHRLPKVRFASGPVMEAAPLIADADSDEALRQQTRAASRTQAQKARAMKRALRFLQIFRDKAAKQELSRVERESMIELLDGMNMPLDAPAHDAPIVAADFPTASPRPFPTPAMTDGGGCAGE